MSGDQQRTISVALLGAGCATLSLAARASELATHEMTVIDPQSHPAEDHIWGFWMMPWLANVKEVLRKDWFQWRIISADHCVTHITDQHPYCALRRHDWMARCREFADANGVGFAQSVDPARHEQILDSRPPTVPKGMMLQHFLGYEVEAKTPVFDDKTAILMDFRCDQTLGMHFIYCLPFSDRHALIESTIFSPNVAPKSYYRTAINSYMRDVIAVEDFTILREETGVIPLGVMAQRDPKLTGIGGNGGAIRPSSGYAFGFIQKQIDRTIARARVGTPLIVETPHSHFEIVMDHIFLAVIRNDPERAPEIFTRLADCLSGDEFALFLSGEASARIWVKVVMAMPKKLFIKTLFRARQRQGVQ